MNTKGKIFDCIRATALFSKLDDEAIFYLCKHASLKSVPKGQVLFVHQDPATHAYIVLSGWVKLFRESADGDETIVDMVSKGRILGETSLFEGGIYPYGAEVTEACEYISLPLFVLQQEVERNHTLAMEMLKELTQRKRKLSYELERRTFQNAAQRLGCFLLRLLEEVQGADERMIAQLPYDKMLVAGQLGMKPETFSRALSKLKESVDMSVQGNRIHLKDVTQLTSYVCGACSSVPSCSGQKIVNFAEAD